MIPILAIFLSLLLIVSTACSGNGDTPTPTSHVPSLGTDIIPEQLAAMVLTQEDIDTEFPSLRFDAQSGGFVDNAESAHDTYDPDDTAEDITTAGRLDGYEHEFLSEAAPLSGNLTAPVAAISWVDVFQDPSSAREFLQAWIQEQDRFQGIPVGETIITNVEHIEPPALGEGASAFRLVFDVHTPEFKLAVHCVKYQRGSLIASVCVQGPLGQDQATAVARLAQRMDQRINGALSGQIVVAPLP